MKTMLTTPNFEQKIDYIACVDIVSKILFILT